MLNVLGCGMVFLGVVWGIISGNMGLLTDGILNGAGDAISLCITMAGILSFWCGLMEIAGQAGLLKKLTGALKPFVGLLFPRIPEGHPAREAISTNLAANILGLGWAATPAGLEAMKQLEEMKETGRGETAIVPRGTASREMCTFLILNISSLQLIPVNMIAYRSRYGSGMPEVIVGPAILVTLASTATAVLFCRIMERSDGRKNRRRE